MIFANDNIWNPRIYPGHTIVASEQATNHEVAQLVSGRRDLNTYFTGLTGNTAVTITATCDRPRAATYCWLDRVHNLSGKTITLSCSDDAFAVSSETVFSLAVPTYSGPGNASTNLGVRTWEGAWWKVFDLRAAKYWRLTIAAMGVGLIPRVGFLMTGLALPLGPQRKPVDLDRDRLYATEERSVTGWLGRGRATRGRVGVINYGFDDYADYEEGGRFHVQGLWGDGCPTVICRDEARGDQAFLAQRVAGDLGVGIDRGTRSTPVTELAYQEVDPLTY